MEVEDWKLILSVVTVIVLGCAGFCALEWGSITDAQATCDACINTCQPTTVGEAYGDCKVCYMSPIDGEYLYYKTPHCGGGADK